jgi:circadian clock protein KaiB
MKQRKTTIELFEQRIADAGVVCFELRLYVGGTKPNSSRALHTLKGLCETHLKDRYVLEVVDIFQSPEAARLDQIVAVPTLILKKPPPERRFIGDLSGNAGLLAALNVTV